MRTDLTLAAYAWRLWGISYAEIQEMDTLTRQYLAIEAGLL
jgi:hypothetical protein